MIARLDLLLRLVTFVAVCWISVVVVWGLVTGERQIETPLTAVWLMIASILVRVALWLVARARPS